MQADVARSTFPSQNVQSTQCSGTLLDLEMLKKCTLFWREGHVQVKMYKAPQLRSVLDIHVSKKCTLLWREAYFEVKRPKENTPRSDHFWTLRSWKRARRCGPKHMWKSKCEKHPMLGPLLDVQPHHTTLHYFTLQLQQPQLQLFQQKQHHYITPQQQQQQLLLQLLLLLLLLHATTCYYYYYCYYCYYCY